MARLPANPTSVTELETNYLECRDYGHSWRLDTIEVVTLGQVEREFHCPRCKMEKTQLLRKDRSVHSTNYRPPKRYHLKGVGRAYKLEIREELINRQL